MHAREIEIARVGLRLVPGDLAEAGEPEPRAASPSGRSRRIFQLSTAACPPSGAISIRASIPFQRVDEDEALEAGSSMRYSPARRAGSKPIDHGASPSSDT